MSGAALVRALAEPVSVLALDARGWEGLIAAARAEQIAGTLAHRLGGLVIPAVAAQVLEDARLSAVEQRRQALWEVEMARRALAPLSVPVVLLKGSAFLAAGLDAGVGRSVGDLDILVPRDALPKVERALIAAGWEWVKEDAYDHLYYRRWMHELPPLIHRARDRMIDVHHTILPPTARPKPDAAALIADSVALGEEDGLRTLSPTDMVIHAAAHLFADGDLAGGIRNLWDIDRLLREHDCGDFWASLQSRAQRHGLVAETARAVRLSARVYGTPVDAAAAGRARLDDALYVRRMLARDGWGRATRPAMRFGFYVRSHWLRMPPLMLARHLWIKARKGNGG